MGEGTVDRLATSQQSMRCEKRKTIKSSNTNLRSRKVIVFLSRRLRNENIFAARISCAKIAIIFSSSLSGKHIDGSSVACCGSVGDRHCALHVFISAGKACFDEGEVFDLQRSRRLDDCALVRSVWP
ncbi:MAG: hypothetical protein G4V63_06330, partial [Candidatus Afipia apatlaquensis]|nr:hypothetical protein [Candidatus Afipia apatlaquensis]